MTKIVKISILLGLFGLILATNFVLAQESGFFLEDADKLLIYDNLYINGYLMVEAEQTNRGGSLGDLIVDNNLQLAADKNVYFCDNSTANTNCAQKLMLWKPALLEVQNENLNLLRTNTLEAATVSPLNLVVKSGKNINTSSPVKIINNCLNNSSAFDCATIGVPAGGLLVTDKLIFSRLVGLSNDKTITFNPTIMTFSKIDLGSDNNVDKQYICWRYPLTIQPGGATPINCDAFDSAAGNKPNVPKGDLFTSDVFSTITRDLLPISSPVERTGNYKVCCFLNIIF